MNRDAELLGEALGEAKQTEMLTSLFSRRSVLTGLSTATLAMIGATEIAEAQSAKAKTAAKPAGRASGQSRDTNLDIQILNFALHAEYLEGEFYSYSFTGQGMTANGLDVSGVDQNGAPVAIGPTTGGAKINFTNANVQSVGQNVWQDELRHVNFVRSVIRQLGGTPIAKPPMNLAALATKLGVDPASQSHFLIAGRSFCDTGVSAYAGASKYLSTPAVIQGSAQILAVEALHAGALRLQLAQLNISSPAIDNVDVPPPPVGQEFFTLDPTNGFAIIRNPRQVLNVFFLTPGSTTSTAGGFFPQGVYGNLPVLAGLQ